MRLDPDALPKLSGIRAARSVWPYEGSVQEFVRRYKYNGLRSLAPLLAAEMADVLRDWNPPVSAIVHVPAHHARLRERGFDQAELLAREVSNIVGIPLVSALSRVRETAVQARAMNVSKRAENVSGAFEVPDATKTRRANVLLIDDVMTTGATLRESARALRRSGAKTVFALTLAHET